jgi:TPR repeat protein
MAGVALAGAAVSGGRAAVLLAALLQASPAPAADYDAARGLLEDGAAEQARRAMRELALAGDARAQGALARMLVAGVGGPEDRTAGMQWFCVLAHQPDGGRAVVEAVWLLAEYFRTGGGLPGWRYTEGRREREDPVRAYFWFRLLASQGTHYGEVVQDALPLGALGARTTGRELTEAERRAVEDRLARWRPLPVPAQRARCLRLPED